MAATKYMILYRFINEDTNQPMTNDSSLTYEPVCELYSSHHKLYAGTQAQQDEEYQKQQDILINAMGSDATHMFFAYDGLKKFKHPGVDGLHGEEPFFFKDTYKRIQGSPWMTHSICGSLEDALTKAKSLCGAIGKENVKLIKLVAFDQFLKIK